MANRLLKSGRYLVQDMSSARSFVTTDSSLFPSPNAKYEPVVVLPPGIVASTWQFETADSDASDDAQEGLYTVKVHGMPVIQSNDGKVIAYGSGSPYNRWVIEERRWGTGERCWAICTPPGPEKYYWSVSHNPQDGDEHGHRRVVLNAVPRPRANELFILTLLEDETEIITQ